MPEKLCQHEPNIFQEMFSIFKYTLSLQQGSDCYGGKRITEKLHNYRRVWSSKANAQGTGAAAKFFFCSFNRVITFYLKPINAKMLANDPSQNSSNFLMETIFCNFLNWQNQ